MEKEEIFEYYIYPKLSDTDPDVLFGYLDESADLEDRIENILSESGLLYDNATLEYLIDESKEYIEGLELDYKDDAINTLRDMIDESMDQADPCERLTKNDVLKVLIKICYELA